MINIVPALLPLTSIRRILIRLEFFLLVAIFSSGSASLAKQVSEAIKDMGAVQGEDPNGYMLMVISIGLLFFLAAALIAGTMMYMFKGNKKKNRVQAKSDANQSSVDESSA